MLCHRGTSWFSKKFARTVGSYHDKFSDGHCGKRKANFKIILDLTHDSRHIRQVSGTGNGKTLNDGVVKRVIENRIHCLLIRRRQAGKPMSLVFRLTYAALYERDVATEHFSKTEHARTFAERGPEGRLYVSKGRLGVLKGI